MKIGYFKNYPHKAYGIKYVKEHITGFVVPRWVFVIYYGKRYRAFSNYSNPLN